jgi:hypothetical protein
LTLALARKSRKVRPRAKRAGVTADSAMGMDIVSGE